MVKAETADDATGAADGPRPCITTILKLPEPTDVTGR